MSGRPRAACAPRASDQAGRVPEHALAEDYLDLDAGRLSRGDGGLEGLARGLARRALHVEAELLAGSDRALDGDYGCGSKIALEIELRGGAWNIQGG